MESEVPPKFIRCRMPTGMEGNAFEKRKDLHNGRPVWDMNGSLHQSICWTPFENDPAFGFWAVANLWNLDANGQATNVVAITPETTLGDGPSYLPKTSTRSQTPPLGWWTTGIPSSGDRMSGGRQLKLYVDTENTSKS